MAGVKLSAPVLSLSGRIGASQLVFYSRAGRPHVRAFTPRSHSATSDQTAVRAFITAASRQWRLLTDAQRADWSLYAQTHFAADSAAVQVALSGAQVFNKVAFCRQAQGLPLPADAPASPPPAPLAAFASAPVDHPGSFAFTLEHTLADPTGFKLLARISPEIPDGRTPRDANLRYIAGLAPASFLPLPATGATATYHAARFQIPATKQFRAELTIISPESVPSPPLAANFRHPV